MAKKSPHTSPNFPKPVTPADAMLKGIARLDERIVELEAFDFNALSSGGSPRLTQIEVAIADTLQRCFESRRTVYHRFTQAAVLTYHGGFYSSDFDNVGQVKQKVATAIALLREAQRTLREDIADYEHNTKLQNSVTVQSGEKNLSRKVFVVHGHDGEAREMVARFLSLLSFEPIILHEQANQGRTVMEKVEAHGDVGFAVVLLTPDDEGCPKGGKPEPRVRQNVLLELGYFLGRLGRDKVCALKRGIVEIPSDFAGVVWEPMEGMGWKQALGRELETAGHEIDWNKVMRV